MTKLASQTCTMFHLDSTKSIETDNTDEEALLKCKEFLIGDRAIIDFIPVQTIFCCSVCRDFYTFEEDCLGFDSFEDKEKPNQEKNSYSAVKRGYPNFWVHRAFALTKDSTQCNKVLQIGKQEKSLKKLYRSYWKDFLSLY